MLKAIWRTWRTLRTRPAPARRPKWQPGLESLEGRLLLSNGLGTNHLAFLQQPAFGTAGQALTFKVAVEDQNGHVITTDNTDKITVQLAGKPGSFAPGSTVTATVQNGVATFNNLVLDTAGNYVLKASADHTIPTLSQIVAIKPAAASKLAFLQGPDAGITNHPLGPVKVAVEDRFGNILSGDNTDKIQLAVSSGPAGGKLTGTTSITVHHGVAIFSGLTLNVAGNYTLSAAATGLPAATSSLTVFASPVQPINLEKSLKITLGKVQHDKASGLDLLQVTVKNTSSTALSGPLALVLRHLKPGVKLTNAAGTFHGKPFVLIEAAGATLGAGQSVTVTLKFSNPTGGPIPVDPGLLKVI